MRQILQSTEFVSSTFSVRTTQAEIALSGFVSGNPWRLERELPNGEWVRYLPNLTFNGNGARVFNANAGCILSPCPPGRQGAEAFVGDA